MYDVRNIADCYRDQIYGNANENDNNNNNNNNDNNNNNINRINNNKTTKSTIFDFKTKSRRSTPNNINILEVIV